MQGGDGAGLNDKGNFLLQHFVELKSACDKCRRVRQDSKLHSVDNDTGTVLDSTLVRLL